ncbi:50S ribosomal protein L23 [Patescibacteria group bacterium]|jgi:large subunit ribosomal protein L23|nr:50S ribosomal protein L23 [Patescibacteria group bacterium]HPD07624.1 50S ribosomal protein L23 [bacterium]HRT10939.1 50S ribosomal protein L23 [Patescibacteria group bacterium]HRU89790.1 50S ribosomal protein L23 [Patescibacteria group bacterium]
MDKRNKINKTTESNETQGEAQIIKTDRQTLKRGQLASILIKPAVTEKAGTLNELNQYVFVVERGANKITIAKAIEAFYGVKPIAVNIINMPGKKVTRGRIKGQRPAWKKAIVTLPAGKSIAIYEGV